MHCIVFNRPIFFVCNWLVKQIYALVSVVVLLCFVIVAIRDIYDYHIYFAPKNNIKYWLLIFLFLANWVFYRVLAGLDSKLQIIEPVMHC